jgi:hypothetical protein
MSNRTISVTALVAICLVGLFGQIRLIDRSAETSSAFGHSDAPSIVLINNTPYEQPKQIVDWSLDRYEQAGLPLPDIEITFHAWEPTQEACATNGGLWTDAKEVDLIDICAAGVPNRRKLTLHEFAHAWADDSLTEDDQVAFVRERGLESWNDSETVWAGRGFEQVAEIVVWGLYMYCDPPNIFVGESMETLTKSFVELTGTKPLCEIQD